jgi:DmsE family decaheme c-type cytochrome
MKAVSRKGLLSAETELETCAGCHPVSRSQMWMNAHMPVREGSMSCASCHNSHGTIADALITDHTVNDNCYRCHGEKRGPFLWEHSPVYEDCLNCHLAHGSTREAMLKLSVPRLCQQCHVGGHGGNPRNPEHRFVVGSSCLQCHPTIHGSNHPSGIGFAR